MMRVLCLNKRHEYEFHSGTTKNALVFGDLDNDGYDEFAVGNDAGEVLIFKGREVWQKFTKLGFVTCLAIGDILNEGRNCLVVVTGDGFCHIYDSCFESDDQAIEASEELGNAGPKDKHLIHMHTQRVPANVKDLLLGDIDGDGRIEMVLGLSDRVVRSYRWSSGRSPRPMRSNKPDPDRGRAKFIALNKWECAKQIGSITLHHNSEGKPCVLVSQPGGTFMRIRCHAEGSPSLKDKPPVQRTRTSSESENAQQSTVDYQNLGLSRMRSQEIATEILGDIKTGTPVISSKYDTSTYVMRAPSGKAGGSTGDSTPVLENTGAKRKRRRGRKSRTSTSSESTKSGSPTSSTSTVTSTDTSFTSDTSVITQIDTTKLAKDLEMVLLAEEDDANASSNLEPDTCEIETATEAMPPKTPEPTEESVRKESESSATSMTESKPKPYAVATLDGTIMLVQDEVILWALAVDHQIFALGKMDVNNDELDEIVACAWDGQVYFIDQHKTCVKFNFDQPVRAFACGMFSAEKEKAPTPAMAFITFKERLYIYFDVFIKHMAVQKFRPDLTALAPLYVDENTTLEQAKEKLSNLPDRERQKLVSYLLYNE